MATLIDTGNHTYVTEYYQMFPQNTSPDTAALTKCLNKASPAPLKIRIMAPLIILYIASNITPDHLIIIS